MCMPASTYAISVYRYTVYFGISEIKGQTKALNPFEIAVHFRLSEAIHGAHRNMIEKKVYAFVFIGKASRTHLPTRSGSAHFQSHRHNKLRPYCADPQHTISLP